MIKKTKTMIEYLVVPVNRETAGGHAPVKT